MSPPTVERPRTSDAYEVPPEAVLVTGFPAFTARRFVAHLLERDPRARVFLLARGPFVDEARGFLAGRPPAEAARVEVVEGDVCDMDLGLSGRELTTLADQVTTIHHMAGIYWMGVDKDTARRTNVEGTRGVLTLAREARQLRRLVHWSTAAVSGKRKGVILEEELDEGQAFHNVYEETKFHAEVLARAAMRELPITILRPGVIVGDSRTGEIDKFDGPYYLLVLIASNALNLRVPLPGRGSAPLHLVPIDFVVEAAYPLSLDDRAAGKTLHLTDPNPLSARKVYELVAELSEGRLARGFVPTGLARTLLRAPGLEKLARAPRSFLEAFDRPCFYNCRTTLELLDGTGVRCPSFDRYAGNLVAYVREVQAEKRRRHDDDVAVDPLD
jgi:thioester reductase-like protein